MAGELLARLLTLAGRDQKEATFVLNMTADWPTLDEEGKTVIYQGLSLPICFSCCVRIVDCYSCYKRRGRGRSATATRHHPHSPGSTTWTTAGAVAAPIAAGQTSRPAATGAAAARPTSTGARTTTPKLGPLF